MEDGVGDGGGEAHDGSFAGAGRGQVGVIDQHYVDFGHVAEARHAVLREARIRDLPIAEADLFEERAAEGHGDGALDLVLEVIGINHRAAVEGLHYAQDADAFLFDGHLGAGGDVAVLLESAGDADALALTPSEALGGGLEHGAETIVLQVLETEFERVHFERVGQLIDVHFTREMVGGGGQAAVGSLAERRLGGVESIALVGDVVLAQQGRAAGVVVVALPGRDCAIAMDAA